MAILYIKVFDPQNLDTLDIRLMQFQIGLVFTILLAVVYKPMDKFLRPMMKTKAVSQQKWSEVMFAITGCALVFGLLTIAYSPK